MKKNTNDKPHKNKGNVNKTLMEEIEIRISEDPEVGLNISETKYDGHTESEISISKSVNKVNLIEIDIILNVSIEEKKKVMWEEMSIQMEKHIVKIEMLMMMNQQKEK